MTSSMLTSDRRWAPRKFTVLGKVPKPINLPSQRLENHGLDPNVEIVPKGTLTWGSRPSLAAPNAWGTSSVSSPHADGSAGSPSHRPSSGGSGTRPSTAGSDRSHEPVSNAWGPNSRPSSASGILTSSQISAAATRPRSAETRPGSSQLSRFADNSIDGAVAWGAAGTAERLGTTSFKSSGFTLSSGDFPSLGSDKNSDTHSHRGHSSQGRPHSSQGRPHSSQARPASASGTDSNPKEFLEPQLAGNRTVDHLDHETVNTWKADTPPYAEHSVSPNMENWHRDPHPGQPYPNVSMPPPHYDTWHNSPFRPADGAWYRGGAAGCPYRPPGAAGSYPIDYPHVPGRPLSNPQFPMSDAGPHGLYPTNCEPYRPYMPPERYMGPSHPDFPVRPGAYPGPVPFEGYYGPPHPNFRSSSERDASVMGRSRAVHNQYPTQHQNYDSVNFHESPGGYATMINKEQRKPDQTYETQGQYRVLLKQHDGPEDCDRLEEEEHSLTGDSTHLGKGNHPLLSGHKGDLGTKSQIQETAVSPILAGEAVSSQPNSGVDVQSTGTVVKTSLADSSRAGKAAADGHVRRPEAATILSCDLQQCPVIRKNATLMEKVEGLNNKARIADSHSEGGPVSFKEKSTFLKDVNARTDQFTKVACASTNSSDSLNIESALSKELNTLTEDKNQGTNNDRKFFSVPLNSVGAGENAHILGQKKAHVAKSVDHHAKLRSNRHDNDEWMKKPPGSESSTSSAMNFKVRALECNASQETLKKQQLHLHHTASCKDGSQTITSVDPVDQKVQCATMSERALQRAKQLQEEEEERTREQKAKALAKLEELNRRTLAESSYQKSSNTPPQSSNVLNCSESEPVVMSTADTPSVEASNATSVCHSESVKQVDDNGIEKPGNSTDLSSNVAMEASFADIQSSLVPQAQSLPIVQESDATTKIKLGTSDIQHDPIAKQKQMGYRKKHSNSQENSIGGKPITSSSTRSPKPTGEIAVNASNNDTLRNNKDPPVPHKKKIYRSSRNNNINKLDEGLTSTAFPSPSHTEGSSDNLGTESGKTPTLTLVAEAISVTSESSNGTVGTLSSRGVPNMPVNQGLPETTEEARGRVNNHWKPHPQGKTTRNQQASKPVSKYHVTTEAVMWAPVKPPSKNETFDKVSQNSMTGPTKLSGKNGNELQSGLRAKRAEIERYVPKPVAKELSQQVNSQQTPPSLNQEASGDMMGKSETGLPSVESVRLDGPTVEKTAAASDPRNGDNSEHNKDGRTNASWHQQSSAKSPPAEGLLSSDHVKAVQKGRELLQPSNIDDLPKDQLAHTNDGWNDDNDRVLPSESVTSTVFGKSYGANRQRRQSYKVHKVSGSNYPPDGNDSQQAITDKCEHQASALGHNASEGRYVGRTESQNAAAEYAKPHWQPKSQAYSHGWHMNKGSRGGQTVASQGTENAPAMEEDINTFSQITTVSEARNAHHQESRRERRVTADSAKEQTAAEIAPPKAGYQRELAAPSGVNQRGQPNGRFRRGYEPSYRARDLALGQDSSKQNFQMNEDRWRNNPHIEYQRVGSYEKPGGMFQQNPNADEGAHEDTWAPGSRYRERGRVLRRGGGQFYGRSSGAAARVGDSYDSRECS